MIAIAGAKGGCGKTTTTLGVAAALAAAGREAIAVDLDRGMPDLHAAAGVDREPTLGDSGASNALPAQESAEFPGVGIVPAPRTPGDAGVERVLSRVRGESTVLLDCPAGVGPDAATPLRRADASIVVATATPAGLRGAAKTAAIARALDAPPVTAVVTRCGTLPDGTRDLLGVERAVSVPQVDGEPLHAPAVRGAYRRVAGILDEWTSFRDA